MFRVRFFQIINLIPSVYKALGCLDKFTKYITIILLFYFYTDRIIGQENKNSGMIAFIRFIPIGYHRIEEKKPFLFKYKHIKGVYLIILQTLPLQHILK